MFIATPNAPATAPASGFTNPTPFAPSRAEQAPASGVHFALSHEPVSAFWQGLTTGRLRLLETQVNSARCIAIAREQTQNPRSALSERERLLVNLALQAESQKSLAYGFDLSPAVVSQVVGNALEKLGLSRRLGSTPLPIVLAALAHCGMIEVPQLRSARFHCDGHAHVMIDLPAPDPALLVQLSESERKIAVLFACGKMHSQIAALRGTAVRTVSNQIATLCRKLAQHGRFELVRYWASLQWGTSAGAV